MKKLSIIHVLAAFLVGYACQSGSDANQSNQQAHEEMHDDHAAEDHDHADHDDAELVLNDGQKWQADEPTRKNVAHLESLSGDFESKPPATISELHEFGREVKSGIDQMIRECTMTGAPDQALHHWFFPILDDTNELRKTENPNEARQLAHSIMDRINVFDQYFD